MFIVSEIGSRTSIAIALPERVFTRSGSSVDPRHDVWQWTDGPYQPKIDFGRYRGGFRALVPFLKQALIPFLKGHSGAYVTVLNNEFYSFSVATGESFDGAITPQNYSNFAAVRTGSYEPRLAPLSLLLRKWVQLGLPGVHPSCETYLLRRRIPGGAKGGPVKTRDPIAGPFSEDEYTALNSAVNAAYGREDIPLWALILTRLLLACGGRISQYASLKICDFAASTRVLSLPQAKTGEQHMRTSFLACDIEAQTAQILVDYIAGVRASGNGDHSPLFPESFLKPGGKRKRLHAAEDLFYDHCRPEYLSKWFEEVVSEVAPPTARLDFAQMPVRPRRFRYTLGTRMAEEGASKVEIANRLGHVDLQNVDSYFSASPKVLINIDSAMGSALAPLAQAFQGKLVEDEGHTTHKGASGSRIIDFRVSNDPVGSCAGKSRGCAFNKPVACYTCIKFEPWLDAPHEKVLQRLEAEREKFAADERMAAVNDAPIEAVREVIWLCTQVARQRSQEPEEASA